jgi:SulP family sulfate permease
MDRIMDDFRALLAHPLRLLPFMAWIGQCRDLATLRADIVAGITVALILVPQAMAYASLAGLPPYYGLYAAFVPGVVSALFGSSRQLATGPVAVVSLMTAAALEPLALAPDLYIACALSLALMTGIFQLALGVLRMGVLVDLLSHPVVIGFTNAAAIIIATSQLGKLFGVSVAKGEHHYDTVWRITVAAAHDTHAPTLLMGMLAIAIMILVRKYIPKLPNVLAAVAITTLVSWLTGFNQHFGGNIVGAIPQGITPPGLPRGVTRDILLELVSSAAIIAVIGFMESISIARALASRTRQRLDPNQELIGQGLGNIASGLFQGFAVSGSFARSAVNLNSGAVTGLSSVVTGLAVGATLLFLTPLLYHLPQATLAAIIMVAVLNLIRLEPIRHAWRAQRHDGVVAVVTFALTLVVAPRLEAGIVTGIVMSLALFLFRIMRPRISILSRDPDGTLRDAQVRRLSTCDNIALIRFDGPLFFANTAYFSDTVLERVARNPDLKFVIIDAEGINEIDATGEAMLHELERSLDAQDIELLIARAKQPIVDALERTGLVEAMGAHRFFRLRTHAFNHAWSHLEAGHADTCPLLIPRPASDEQDIRIDSPHSSLAAASEAKQTVIPE